MLPQVAVGRHCCAQSTDPNNYRPLVGDTLVDELMNLAKSLAGVRICEINATAAGGGVAELLGAEIPILDAMGVDADWRLIHGDAPFFEVTKAFHNALQGADIELTETIKQTYLDRDRACAELIEGVYDVYIVHDPQPAALRHFAKANNARWIWRCHIDSSEPNPHVWNFLKPFIAEYDALVFTMKEFCPPDLKSARTEFIAPAIDPLSTKNMELPEEICKRVIANSGIDLHRPLLLQVSRFDPWKDPLGVIKAYRLAKEKQPEIQLALIGAMAGDDPEGWRMLEAINAESAKDRDMYVFTNLTGVGNMEVNAFQRGADIVIQKSLREGFGLVVSEALWKGRPVVAGRAGGIPMQFPDGYEDYLVSDVEDCARKVLKLLEDSEERKKFGYAGPEKVRKEFLLPRLMRDELKLIAGVLGVVSR
ncbi:MAG: glycosyltransferase [Chloroflexota bacterium]